MANEDEKNQETKQKSSKGAILQWAILGLIILGCAASGAVLGRILAGPTNSEASQPAESGEPENMLDLKTKNAEENQQQVWYYKLEPVVANLDEPKVTRYVRATLTLVVSNTMSEKKGLDFFETKKPYIINWLTIYLASLTVEDIRGEKNLKRIQSDLASLLNEKLFPDSEQYIKGVLIQEFPVQ